MKSILWLCGFMLFFLACLSLYFFQERVIYSDSAYNTFNMLNSGNFEFNHNRYGLFITQIIPLIFLKLGCSVSFFLKLYSVSNLIIISIVFCILIKIKQPKMAILLTLIQILAYRESWFLALNETNICIAMVLLLVGLIHYYHSLNTNLILKIALLSIPISIALFSHPIALILIVFVLVFYLIEKKKEGFPVFFIIFGILLFIVVLKKVITKSSSYEEDLYNQLGNAKSLILNIKSLYSTYFFCGNFTLKSIAMNLYTIPILVFIGVLINIFFKKTYLLFLYCLISTIGFWILLIIVFNRGDGNILMEKNFAPWVLICIYPLCFIEIKKQLHLKFLFAALLLLFILNIYRMSTIAPIYQKRILAIEKLLTVKNPTNNSKLLIQDSTVNYEIWQNTWALPYETLLYSNVNCNKIISAKIYKNEALINKELHRDDIFLSADFFPVDIPNWNLNKRYFNLEKSKYLKVENPN